MFVLHPFFQSTSPFSTFDSSGDNIANMMWTPRISRSRSLLESVSFIYIEIDLERARVSLRANQI